MIVIGVGYGDEGKGLTTSWLCEKVIKEGNKPIVVRFNGGHQAGHTVEFEGKHHVFSGFGSGSLQGVPTFWSQFCTFYPNSFLREYKILQSMGLTPKIYVDPMCPITTPFDIDHNRIKETMQQHGSVGMGFGATINRQENFYKLHVMDMFYPTVMRQKLRSIADFYGGRDVEEQIDFFMKNIEEVLKIIEIVTDQSDSLNDFVRVYEGAQGVLLDMDFGFFPNVTRSNTTSKNALILAKRDLLPTTFPEIYYVTRSYSTRHGNGFLKDEKELSLVNNEKETNKPHKYQGVFRTAELSTEMLNYALEADNNFSGDLDKNLVITCMDQYPIDVDALLSNIDTKFKNVYLFNGPSLTNIKLYERKLESRG